MKFCLVMWALGYPLVCYIGRYMNAKTRKLENYLRLPENEKRLNELLQTLMWILGCLVILRK